MEIENIVQTKKNTTKHFFFFYEVMEISSRKIFAGITSTVIRQWSEVPSIFGIGYFDISTRSKCLSMSSQSRRQYTIKHIKSLLNSMSNILRSSDSHQISRLICRQLRSSKCYYFTNQILTFSHTHPSDSNPIPGIIRKKIY